MPLAASSDSKITIDSPLLSFRVQYPATNPGACDTPGTTCSRRVASDASRSSIVTPDYDCVHACSSLLLDGSAPELSRSSLTVAYR